MLDSESLCLRTDAWRKKNLHFFDPISKRRCKKNSCMWVWALGSYHSKSFFMHFLPSSLPEKGIGTDAKKEGILWLLPYAAIKLDGLWKKYISDLKKDRLFSSPISIGKTWKIQMMEKKVFEYLERTTGRMHQSFGWPTGVDLGRVLVPSAMINGGIVCGLLLVVLGTIVHVENRIVAGKVMTSSCYPVIK